MKIGINVSWMTPGHAGGMEWYARGLVEQLAKIDKINEYLLLLGPLNYKTFSKPGPKWKVLLYEGVGDSPLTFISAESTLGTVSKRRLYKFAKKVYVVARSALRSFTMRIYNGNLAKLLEREGVDVWFCPFMYSLPIDTKLPIVNTIPDLQHEYYPELFDEEELRLRTAGYQYSCKAAAATIGISGATARDIINSYSIDPEKVFAIPLSLDPSFDISPEDLQQHVHRVRTKFRLDGDYIYFPANGWPHKNHEKLVEAMHHVRKRGCDLKLIFTGTPFDLMDRMKDVVGTYGLHDCVRHLGYVDREDVIGLYGGCKMLVFPSTFEGFGIPLLEAMSLGIPVVCSDVTSLPEVGGNAPIYFDPKDPESMADAIVQVATDDALRDKMISAGKERVKQFSYRKVAEQTYEVFQKISTGKLQSPGLEPPRGLLPLNRLCDGHSWWYFHCRNLKEVRLKILQDTALPELADQRISVLLNEKLMIESLLDSERECGLSLIPEEPAPDGFYRLDVSAEIKKQVNNEVLSARVMKIDIVNHDGKVLRLV